MMFDSPQKSLQQHPQRRVTRPVNVGGVLIGGGAPVSVQSMTNTLTKDTRATIRQIQAIHRAGGELVRVAVNDEEAVEALPEIITNSPLPVIADIHFSPRLAVAAIEKGVAKIRINPGNIGGPAELKKIAAAASSRSIPIRTGVNAGSLHREVRKKYGQATPEAIVESALMYVQALEEIGFTDIIISLKASDVLTTFQACTMLAGEVDYPFHIGITEAGPLYRGTVKSAVGIGALLLHGLGDTIRVSLSADPVAEIKAARLILQGAGVRSFGPDLVSCPTCGRCRVDVIGLASAVEKIMDDMDISAPIKIAVMGCEVNGPGEAKDAHLGLAGAGKKGIIFRRGKIVRRVEDDLLKAFSEELMIIVREENLY